MKKFIVALGLAAFALVLNVSGAEARKKLHCIRQVHHRHHHIVHHVVRCNCAVIRVKHHRHHIRYSEGETLPPPPPRVRYVEAPAPQPEVRYVHVPAPQPEVRYVEAPPPPPRVVYVPAPQRIVYVHRRIIGYRFVEGPPPMMVQGGYGYGYGYHYGMHRRIVRFRHRWDMPY